MRRISVITAAVLATLSAAPAAWAQATPAPALAAAQSEDARLAAWFETAFDQSLALSPESMTSLGLKTDYDKLDDYTDAGSAEGQALAERQLAEMKARFDYDALSPQSQVSWRLASWRVAAMPRSVKAASSAVPGASFASNPRASCASSISQAWR